MLLGSEKSYATTRVMETFGYVSPDFANTGMLTEGSNVCSFGVLLMEIIIGRSLVDYSRQPGEDGMTSDIRGFTRVLQSGSPNNLMEEIPTFVVDPLPDGLDWVATPLSMDTPVKSAGNMDKGLMYKLKEFDGLAVSIGNGNADNIKGETDHGFLQSGETEGSGDGSDGNIVRVGKNCKKRSCEGTPNATGDRKTQRQSSLVPIGVANGASKVMGVTIAYASVVGKVMGTAISPSTTTTLELRNLPIANAKMNPTSVPHSSPMISNEAWPHMSKSASSDQDWDRHNPTQIVTQKCGLVTIHFNAVLEVIMYL